MIYDLFTFFNEIELLELRLNTLNDVVDKFVLLEADRTFTGHPKRMYYDELRDDPRFAPFKHKITHLKCTADPETIKPGDDIHTLSHNAWQREFYQRNMLIYGVDQSHLKDTIMLSDVDEIPNPETIIEAIENYVTPTVVIQKLFFYHVNWLRPPGYWHGTALATYSDLATHNVDLQMFRQNRYGLTPAVGGWHFCAIGGAHRVATKMKAFAHVECDIHGDLNQTAEKLEECFKTASDAFDPNIKMQIVKYNPKNYPPYMANMIERHPDWVK